MNQMERAYLNEVQGDPMERDHRKSVMLQGHIRDACIELDNLDGFLSGTLDKEVRDLSARLRERSAQSVAAWD